MGSIVGVILAAFVLILLPEYLRVFADYRMLLFGAILVIMMVFRPQGIVAASRRTYTYAGSGAKENKAGEGTVAANGGDGP
jgi:branched-chain amino acid transport system permease protein